MARAERPRVGRRFIPCFLSPSDDATLSEGEQAEERDGHRRENDDRGEEPRRLQLGVVLEDQVAETGGSSPTHSPKTAPIAATATAILAPLKK